jgi:RNA polymerase sigma factor (sigma-70 family)
MDDSALLREFAANHSEPAFTALVARHVNLVYSVAMRSVGDPGAAEEITQAVFIILARKAGQLRSDKALSSWLFQTTRLTANNFLRSETRRHRREQEAYDMQTLSNAPEPELELKITPMLDSAVAALNEKDRRAILLRFYEGKNLREIGDALGAGEAAAEKRVSRAVEKLRAYFSKRGVSSTSAMIAGTISGASVQAAPIGLAKTVSAVAIAKGSIAAAPTITLVQATMKTMTWLKIKFASAIVLAGLLAGGAATIVLSADSTDAPAKDAVANTNSPQVLIAVGFLKLPTAMVDSESDLVDALVKLDPGSKPFRDLVAKHPEVSLVAAPRVVVPDGKEASVSFGPSQAGGTNATTGLTLHLTPQLQADSTVHLKFKYELREPVPGGRTLRTVTQEMETADGYAVPLGKTMVLGQEIVDGGQTAGNNSKAGSETLLVFVKTSVVKMRLQSVLRKMDPSVPAK